MPTAFDIARIVAVYKEKGDPGDADNYRPIALLQVCYKLYETLILNRLKLGIGDRIHSHQFGFQSKLSVDNAVFSILRAVEFAHNLKNFPIFVLLLDWCKAFDKVNIVRMLRALARLGVPNHMIEVISSLYRDPEFYVQDRFGRSTTAKQRGGLRQGAPMSGFLFIAMLTVIMHDAEKDWTKVAEEKDYIARDTVKNILGRDFALYADDTNLVTGCIRTMRAMLHAIQREGALYGLFLNISKTFLIRAGQARKIAPRLVDLFRQVPIPQVDFERTLGFDIGPFVMPRDTLRKRGRAMLGAMEQYSAVWQSDLPQKTKLERYDSLVVSKGIWGLHVLSVLPTDFAYLEYIHGRCLRRILGIKAAFISRISHAAVRDRAHVDPLQCRVRRNQMKLLGHILRRPYDHPDRLCIFQPNDALEPRTTPDAVRRVGRPRTVWTETIVPTIERLLNRPRTQIHHLAQNRQHWYEETERLCSLLRRELQADV